MNIKQFYHQCNIRRYQAQIVLKGYFKSLRVSTNAMRDPIDLVVTWVDGADDAWRKEKDHFFSLLHPNHEANSESRYREWGTFVYFFRALEKYAPWVRYVHLVTCGHLPCWLNLEHPKLRVVKHTDFIDEKYLPTFNSVAIELNLHKIPGLSEHFIYLNDDVFLAKPVVPEDFFQDGFPVETALAQPIYISGENGHFPHQLLGVTGLINGEFSPSSYMVKHPEKWFSRQYREDYKYNIRALQDDYAPGFFFSHLAVMLRKNTMKEVWDKWPTYLDEACSHRFREYSDITHQIFTVWDMVNGEFIPCNKNDLGVGFNRLDEIEKIKKAFFSQKYRVICLNDNELISDFEQTKLLLQSVLQSAFPEKSSFEK